ncbi:MAG: hypothetical protein LBT47_04800 [Deltaproteobacteria bacterium]|jgi:hypothetical protein|nr:hypothetical protein [Deltaproteobacteria bacterium]
MPASALRRLEWFISDSNKAYCYQIVDEWQRGEGGDYELMKVCHHVERELLLAERFDKTEKGVLLKSGTFPAINENIFKRFFADISMNVIKVDDITVAVENRRTVAWYDLTEDYIESLYFITHMHEFVTVHR